MKRITGELECSHSATFEAEQVPAQPNHKHVECKTCGGGLFAVLRVTKVEEIETPSPSDETKAVEMFHGSPEVRFDHFNPNDHRGEAGTEVIDGVVVNKVVPPAEPVITEIGSGE